MARYAAKKAPPAPIAEGLFSLPLDEFIARMSPNLGRFDHLQMMIDTFSEIDRCEVVREVEAAPCQHGKSTLAIHGLAWLIGRHPDWPVIYATYSQEFSAANSREIRRIYTEAGGPLQEDFNTIKEWKTGKGGGLFATSPGGPGTGKPSRLFWVDDPIKDRAEAESHETRLLVSTWFRSVALTRQGPKSSYVIMASRYHEEDLSGYAIKELGWPYKRLQAINENGEALCPYGPDPEAPRNLEFLLSIKEDIGPYEWESLFQGNPKPPTGACFKDATLCPEIPAIIRWSWGIDLAYTDASKSDKTAMVLLGLGTDGCVYVAYVHSWQKSLEDSAPLIRNDLALQPSVRPVSYVSGNERGHIETLARENPPVLIDGMPARYNKLFRAQGTSRSWNTGKMRVLAGQAWTAEYVSRMCGFDGRDGGKDDEVDATVAAFDMLMAGASDFKDGKFAFGSRRM